MLRKSTSTAFDILTILFELQRIIDLTVLIVSRNAKKMRLKERFSAIE